MDVFNNIGDQSTLSPFRLWLPLSRIFFSFFCSNTTSNSFVHSFILLSFGWFIHGGMTFYFGHYWEQQHQQQIETKKILLSCCTFGNLLFTIPSWMFFNNIGDHSKLKTIRLWLPVVNDVIFLFFHNVNFFCSFILIVIILVFRSRWNYIFILVTTGDNNTNNNNKPTT
jgi:hypothetical protein